MIQQEPASAIGAYLRAEIDRRAITDEEFARRADMPKSSLSNILHTPGIVPRLETLAGIASALDMPLGRLIEVCGYRVGHQHQRANTDVIADMIEAVPELRGLMRHLLPLPTEHLQAIDQYVRYYLQELQMKRGD